MALLNFPDPGVTQNYTANGNSWLWNGTSWVSANSLNLSSQVSGVLGTAYGGTGKTLTGMTVGSVIYADTSSSFAALAPGTSNYVLATQGSGSPPYWKIDDSGTGSVGNGNTGGFAYYNGLNTITSSTGVSYISVSNRIVLTSQILSLPSSVIDSGVWAGTAISLANGGTNGNRSGLGVSYELAVFNAAGTAITQIETTSSIGNSVLLQTVQSSFPIWVGQSSLSVGSATTSTTAGLAVSSTNAGLAVSSTSAGLAVSSTNAGLAVSSTSAGLAVSSTSAGLAVSSTNAGLAVSSTNAGLAVSSTNAGLAVSSTNAGLAVSSTNAGLAVSSTNAGFAASSTNTANTNIVGDTTSQIFFTGSRSSTSIGNTPIFVLSGVSALGNTITATTFSGNATTATNAGLAVSSTSAGLAISSTNAGLAVSSTSAGLAVSSTNAGLAVSSTNAGLAVSSTSAGLAISSTNAGLAVSSTNAGLAVSASRSETIRTQTLSGTNFLALSSIDSPAASQSLFVGSGVSFTSSLFVVPVDTRVGKETNSNNTSSGALIVSGGVGITGNLNVGGNFVLTGDLTVNGTTTTVNSTVSTIVDPIITIGTSIGGTVPNSADTKDRGVAFYYFSGTGKTGFFGWDQSAGKYALFTDATISGEIINGTKGVLVADLDGNAGTATTATTAGIAGSSTTAGLAVSSTNAGLAVSSTNAGLAVSSTNAGLAVSSTNAGLAVSSTNAGLAVSSTNAGFAASSTNTANINIVGGDITSTIYIAGSRSNASIGNTPIYVLSGVSAVGSTITAITFSGNATTATNAGLAVSSTNAGLAVSSTNAGLAVSSTNAGLAVSSTNAGLAVSSTNAGLAVSSTNAGLAVSSTNAGLAVSSTNAGLSQRVNLTTGVGSGVSFLVFSDVFNGTASLGATSFIRINASAGSIGATSFTGNWAGNAVTALYGGTGLDTVSKLNVLTGASSGNSWVSIGSSWLPTAYVGEFAPPFLAAFGATQAGQLWWDSTYGVLKVYYADLNTNQWVDALPVLGSNGGSVKRSYYLSFGAGFTPSTGADSVSVMVPFASDNSEQKYYIKRLDYRNETASSGAGVSFYVERNTTRTPTSSFTIANTIFSAAGSSFKAGAGIFITSYTLAGSGASFVSSAGVAASVISGDYLRLNFTALNSGATMSIGIMIEEQ